MRLCRNNSGQYFLEYLSIFIVVVAVVLYFAGGGGPFRSRYEGLLNQSANYMACTSEYVWEHGVNCMLP